MGKNQNELAQHEATLAIDETTSSERFSSIIGNRKGRTYAQINHEVTMMFWAIGRYINSVIIDNKRAAYGKKVFAILSLRLVEKCGKGE